MADEADKAQAYEQALIDRGIAAARKRAAGHQIIDGGMVVCIDCDEIIPSDRLRAAPHANRCVACQKEQEQERY